MGVFGIGVFRVCRAAQLIAASFVGCRLFSPLLSLLPFWRVSNSSSAPVLWRVPGTFSLQFFGVYHGLLTVPFASAFACLPGLQRLELS